jgi:hypothetical protein
VASRAAPAVPAQGSSAAVDPFAEEQGRQHRDEERALQIAISDPT